MDIIDLSFISNFFKDIYDFVVYIINFITSGLYDFYVEWYTVLVQYLILFSIKWTVFALDVAGNVAQNLLADLNISAYLEAAYSNFDSNTLYYLTVVRFPEIINNLLSGLATGFAMRFIPSL